MKLLLIISILVCLSCLTPLQLKAQTDSPTSAISYSQALTLLNKGSKSLDKDSLTTALAAFVHCPPGKKNDPPCVYRVAETCLYLATALDLDKNRDMAEKILSQGIKNAQEAISLNPDSSETHVLLARLYQIKLMHGDMFTGMDIGPKAGAENKKAIDLDPNNPRAQMSLGIQYVMAPPIGGGDIKKGIATLEKALELDPTLSEAYYWLAKAYRKLNDRPHFEKSLQAGMKLNPQNPMYLNELQSWKN